MRNPLNKRRDALLPPDVEQILRASAAWEPDAVPPSDFADFTRQALEKRERKVWAIGKMQPARWTNALRSPLTMGLASVCVLWAGAKVNAPDAAILSAAPVGYATASPSVEPNFRSPGLVLAATNDWQDAAAVATQQPIRFPSSFRAPATHSVGRRSRRSKHSAAHRIWGAETVAVNKPSANQAVSAAALWKTETVERPAWGALVPVPTAAQCAASSAEVETSEPSEDEATSALLPVLDVALPDVENEMPTSSLTPTPSSAQ